MELAELDRMLREMRPFRVVQFPTTEDRYRVNTLTTLDNFFSYRDTVRTELALIKHESGADGSILHTHGEDEFEMMYVYDGSITHYIEEDETVTVRKGECILLTPGCTHKVAPCSRNDIALNFVMRRGLFQPDFMANLSRNPMFSQLLGKSPQKRGMELRKSYYLFRCAEDAATQSIFLSLIQEFVDSDALSVNGIKAYLVVLFNQLYRVWKKTGGILDPRSEMENADVIELLQYIEHHYATASLKDLAIRFGYDNYYMSRLIRKLTGRTFIDLKHDVCMRQAQRMLLETDLSIREIATRVGISNSNHFYTLFKKYYQISPADYRKMQKKPSQKKLAEPEPEHPEPEESA